MLVSPFRFGNRLGLQLLSGDCQGVLQPRRPLHQILIITQFSPLMEDGCNPTPDCRIRRHQNYMLGRAVIKKKGWPMRRRENESVGMMTAIAFCSISSALPNARFLSSASWMQAFESGSQASKQPVGATKRGRIVASMLGQGEAAAARRRFPASWAQEPSTATTDMSKLSPSTLFVAPNGKPAIRLNAIETEWLEAMRLGWLDPIDRFVRHQDFNQLIQAARLTSRDGTQVPYLAPPIISMSKEDVAVMHRAINAYSMSWIDIYPCEDSLSMYFDDGNDDNDGFLMDSSICLIPSLPSARLVNPEWFVHRKYEHLFHVFGSTTTNLIYSQYIRNQSGECLVGGDISFIGSVYDFPEENSHPPKRLLIQSAKELRHYLKLIQCDAIAIMHTNTYMDAMGEFFFLNTMKDFHASGHRNIVPVLCINKYPLRSSLYSSDYAGDRSWKSIVNQALNYPYGSLVSTLDVDGEDVSTFGDFSIRSYFKNLLVFLYPLPVIPSTLFNHVIGCKNVTGMEKFV